MNSPTDGVRERLVEYYLANKASATYATAASIFGVSLASVSRWLRRKRETGGVALKPRGGNNPRRVDLDWLAKHAEAHPDATLKARVEAAVADGGLRVSLTAMSDALHALGWSHKKKRFLRRSAKPKG